MSTTYHNAMKPQDALSIAAINTRLSDLNSGIVTQEGGVSSMSATFLYDTKATTTDGGSCSATTWNARDLNTEVDGSGIVTISSNKFTPASGDYIINAFAPVYDGGRNKLRLYNVTQASVTWTGTNAFVAASDGSLAFLMYVFTVNGTDEYRIEHYTELAQTTDGLGQAAGEGAAEIFLQIMLMKIA